MINSQFRIQNSLALVCMVMPIDYNKCSLIIIKYEVTVFQIYFTNDFSSSIVSLLVDYFHESSAIYKLTFEKKMETQMKMKRRIL